MNSRFDLSKGIDLSSLYLLFLKGLQFASIGSLGINIVGWILTCTLLFPDAVNPKDMSKKREIHFEAIVISYILKLALTPMVNMEQAKRYQRRSEKTQVPSHVSK